MEQFLYKLTSMRADMLSEGLTDRENEVIENHAAYLSELKDKGVVKLAGRTLNTDESSFGVVIFEAENEKAARLIMANDPAVKENVLAARLFPFRIAFMGNPEA
ncbi:MAG: YciI family protein [Candidatus Krumholzibacteriota bacterium]